MPDPSTLRDMDKGAARLADAIVRARRIAVFGDYDVDGACSSALMQRFLAAHGRQARIYIPDRMTEGYGPNRGGDRDAGQGRRQADRHGRLRHHQRRPAGGGKAARRRRGGRRSSPGRRAAAGRRCGHQSQPAGRPVRPRASVRGGRHVHGAGGDRARAAPSSGHYTADKPAPDLLALLDLVALATVCDVVPLEGPQPRLRDQAACRSCASAATSVCGRSPMPPAWPWRRRPITWASCWGRASMPAGASAMRGSARACSRPRTRWRRRASPSLLDKLNRERKAIEAQMLEEAVALADRLVEADPELPLLLLGSRELAQGRGGAGRQPAGRALPAPGLRHRLGRARMKAPARCARSTASTSARAVRAAVEPATSRRAAVMPWRRA